jgi:hypothetical protein
MEAAYHERGCAQFGITQDHRPVLTQALDVWPAGGGAGWGCLSIVDTTLGTPAVTSCNNKQSRQIQHTQNSTKNDWGSSTLIISRIVQTWLGIQVGQQFGMRREERRGQNLTPKLFPSYFHVCHSTIRISYSS